MLKRDSMILTDAMNRGVLLLDGAMGTALGGTPACCDMLTLTAPQQVAAVHRAYLDAGADIVETNTFNAQAVSLAEYSVEHLVRRINLEACAIARGEADRRTDETPARPRFVAGAVGPTPLRLSRDGGAAMVERVRTAYRGQMSALIDGGADCLLVETVVDAVNARMAARAALDAMDEAGRGVPLLFATALCGIELEEFVEAVAFASPAAVGLNCCDGPVKMSGPLQRLAEISPFPLIAYPNAGLPDALGPAEWADACRAILACRPAIAGGCCGTTPAHIAALRALLDCE